MHVVIIEFTSWSTTVVFNVIRRLESVWCTYIIRIRSRDLDPVAKIYWATVNYKVPKASCSDGRLPKKAELLLLMSLISCLI
jgi:hypothetical protein